VSRTPFCLTVLVLLASGWAACQRSPTEPAGLSAQDATYYVAAEESGADNERCDGRAPSNQGNGRCPFRDFSSPRTLQLLASASGVRVSIRRGTYVLMQGLDINGAGTSEAGRVVLEAYQSEPVVLDGRNAPRELLVVSGRYVTVQGLTLQNAGGYNLEVRGGQQVVIEGNRFLANRASDSLKGDGGAADVVVRNNDFSQWDSQAIDLTAVSRWRIERNRFHDPSGAGANAIGVKFGSRDVTIADNEFTNTQGLSLGGVSSAHGNAFEAFNVVAVRNTFRNVPGFAATLYSCSGCRFQDNEVDGAGGGLRLVGAATSGVSGCAGGCQPSRDVTASGNRLRNLVGGREGPANVFWAVEATEREGLAPSSNTYCESVNGAARFWLAGDYVRFEEWVRAVPTDVSSAVAARTDQGCAG